MTDAYYLTDGAHVLISGVTGAGSKYGGKSTTANWWYYEATKKGWADVGIYFDPKGKSSIKGYTARDAHGVVDLVRSGKKRIHFAPSRDRLEDAHEWVVGFAANTPPEVSVLLVHDEAADYRDGESLDYAISQLGNEANVRSLVLTQRPWDLPERILNNLPLKVWVGPVTPEASRYFDAMQIEGAKEGIEANTAPHRWSVIDGGEYIATHAPVPEGFA